MQIEQETYFLGIMQRQSMLSYYSKRLSAVGFLICCYMGMILLNPKTIGVLDSLILQAPCCEKTHQPAVSVPNYILWNLMVVTYKFSRIIFRDDGIQNIILDTESCCNLCRKYQAIRCHFRTKELSMHRLQWHELKLKDLSLHSAQKCDFEVLPEKSFPIDPSYLFLKDPVINALDTSFINITSSSKNEFRTPLPAVQIKDVSINIHSVFKQVVDVNATGVVINIVTEKDSIRINSSIEVPLTTIRIGDWLLHEIFDLIPPPPKDQGLYPRMGTINVTDVKIVSHTIEGESRTMNEIAIPDEFFYPLYHITNLAGEDGTDQVFVATVLRKSLIMVLRKHAINEEGFISKSMETFLTSIEKSSEFVQEATELIYDKINEWTGILDTGINKASIIMNSFISRVEDDWIEAMNRFMKKVDEDWNEAMKEKDAYFTKFSKEAASFWEGIDENISKAGHKVFDAFEKFENEFNSISNSGMEAIPQIRKEVEDTWYTIMQSFQEAEKDINTRAKKMEKELEEAIDEVTKDAKEGIENFKNNFNNFLDGLKIGNYDKKEL